MDQPARPTASPVRSTVSFDLTTTGILATLTREMHRRQARYGLETMCIGGGQGLAAIVERIA